MALWTSHNAIVRETLDFIQRNGLKFLPLRKNSKRPTSRWKKFSSMPFKETLKYFQKDQNIGIICGESNLFVWDCDNLEVVSFLKEAIQFYYGKKKFTAVVKTPHGVHIYFKCFSKISSRRILRKGRKIVFDRHSIGKYVVAPPSIVDNQQYQWIKCGFLEWLSEEMVELIELKTAMLAKEKGYRLVLPKRKKLKKYIPNNNSLIEKIKSEISIFDLAERYGYSLSPGLNKCIFHDDTHPSLSISDDGVLFYCFGCDVGGDIFDFFAYVNNLKLRDETRIIDREVFKYILSQLKKILMEEKDG